MRSTPGRPGDPSSTTSSSRRSSTLYANALFLYNPFKDLDLRSTIGGGVGYQFWEDVRKKLSFELGVSYVDENFRIAEDNAYAGGRWAINFNYWILPDKIELFHFQEGYFSLEDFKDMNLITEQGYPVHGSQGLLHVHPGKRRVRQHTVARVQEHRYGAHIRSGL